MYALRVSILAPAVPLDEFYRRYRISCQSASAPNCVVCKLAAQLQYRKASAMLREVLPDGGGLRPETTRNRALTFGKRIDKEICDEIGHPQPLAEPALEMIVGIDGAFVRAAPPRRVVNISLKF